MVVVLLATYFYLNSNLTNYIESRIQDNLKKELILHKDYLDSELSGPLNQSRAKDLVTRIAKDLGVRAKLPGAHHRAQTGARVLSPLTNAGMVNRPDLFDPHTVHFHGFPNAAPVFDGMPEASVGINMGASITYYYNLVEPGTFMYHCHVEATEHMQMGMLGNLYVGPMQNGTALPDPDGSGRIHTSFVYNDVDGSTGYDVEVPIQLGSFDPAFHDASMTVQPLPFADMKDKYAMMNGRGYPDTVNPAPLSPPVNPVTDPDPGKVSQKVSSLVTATIGLTHDSGPDSPGHGVCRPSQGQRSWHSRDSRCSEWAPSEARSARISPAPDATSR